MRLVPRILAILVGCGAATAIADDLTLVVKATRPDGTSTTHTNYISGDHVRMTQADGRDTIFDIKSGEMTTIDHTKKQYFTITKQDLQAMMDKIQPMMAALQKLPPELQKRMSSTAGGAFDAQKTGTSRKIAGYACDNWTVTFGPTKIDECISTDLQFPPQAWDGLRDFMSSFATMSPGAAQFAQAMQEKMRLMKGVPLATNSMGISSEATEVSRAPIPPSAWDIPAGYAKVANPMANFGAKR